MKERLRKIEFLFFVEERREVRSIIFFLERKGGKKKSPKNRVLREME